MNDRDLQDVAAILRRHGWTCEPPLVDDSEIPVEEWFDRHKDELSVRVYWRIQRYNMMADVVNAMRSGAIFNYRNFGTVSHRLLYNAMIRSQLLSPHEDIPMK